MTPHTELICDSFEDSALNHEEVPDCIVIDFMIAEYESQGNFDRIIKIIESYDDNVHKDFLRQIKEGIVF